MVLRFVVAALPRGSGRLHSFLSPVIVLLFVTSVLATSLESSIENEERDAQEVLALGFGTDANPDVGRTKSPAQDAPLLVELGTDTNLGTSDSQVVTEDPPLGFGVESTIETEEGATQDLSGSLEPVETGIETWGIDNEGVYSNNFDPAACAKLHNQIMTIVSNAPNQPEHTLRKFFDVYVGEEEELRLRLSGPLLDFLSQIYVTAPPDAYTPSDARDWLWHCPIRFTPLLAQPSAFAFWKHEDWELGDRYILLYGDPEDSTGGVFFDMQHNLICKVDIFNEDMESCPWSSLEIGLARYLELYEVGKFRLPVNRTDIDEDDERYEDYDFDIAVQRVDGADWMMALEMYDSLLEAIAERIDGAEIYEEPLIDRATLTRWGVENFAFEFLSRARKPSFTYIAPGITVFNSSTFNAMMELNGGTLQQWIQDRDMGDMAPILLFPGDTPVDLEGEDELDRYLFNIEHQYLINNMSGVYLEPSWNWGDSIKLVLPYSIGQNGHVRYGSRPDVSVRGHSVLYQHGACPFFGGHHTRLFSLLYKWKESVRSGSFSTGPDGVEGGMELYREADADHPRIDTDVGVCW
ncbi:hypothetical protein K435DRAFT_776100 [Dendrothele bispora CBS 962.96]|uniref:Uncharacterized protein n=1 Tax=Dendrothele bispora (strain CBS 962.96) TaxID=1314807 RepID=A0A4S8MGE2_DENBC|nr:hypothetical protein K435DRAFT_776100 [Dendrothele bispora CBS 962.96]